MELGVRGRICRIRLGSRFRVRACWLGLRLKVGRRLGLGVECASVPRKSSVSVSPDGGSCRVRARVRARARVRVRLRLRVRARVRIDAQPIRNDIPAFRVRH